MQVYIEKCDNYEKHLIDRTVFSWENVLSENIYPGDVVVLKPNWISESHIHKKDEWEHVVTHPLIIESVLELVLKILKGKGKIIITDGPETSASWNKLMEIMNPAKWINMGREANVDVSVLDLRDDEWVKKGEMIVQRKKLQGDPLGSVVCNLASTSEFVGKNAGRYGFFGADYNQKETNEAHSFGNHFYKVSRSVLEADVFINLPKLKAHKKAGITCSLKNLVGINTYKNWLPHHTCGTPAEDGDQFPEKSFRSFSEGSCTRIIYDYLAAKPHAAKFFIPIRKIGKFVFGDTDNTIRSGSWHGNDTLWRMVLDLNKILFYANLNGELRKDFPGNKKRYFSIVDAVVSGEGNGPLAPEKKNTGLIILGSNPVSVDAACAKLMGFNWKKIPIIKNAFAIKSYPFSPDNYEDIHIKSSIEEFNKPLTRISKNFSFKPPLGWKDYIEL